MLEQLKAEVLEANLELVRRGLVFHTFGNVSGRDRESGLVVIKPSGVDYERMSPQDMVVLDLRGQVMEGALHPSSDTPTHLYLYESFPQIGGVAHSHACCATIWAQAQEPIPCLGTTHADYFFGEVPVTRPLTAEEIAGQYERETGRVIVDTFQVDPRRVPAVLVACHGPFSWGDTALEAVLHMAVLEEVARTALGTMTLRPGTPPIGRELLLKHFNRKHGPQRYYGQDRPS